MIVPSAILTASLLGSWHCVGMCGGLILTATRSPLSIAVYHVSRLFGYLLVGTISGFVGSYLFPQTPSILPLIATVLISAYFIYLGIHLLMGRSSAVHFNNPIVNAIFSKVLNRNPDHLSHRHAALVGFGSTFLPCGWLYGFVLGAIQVKDPLIGAGILGIFWLGTLPALLLSPILIKKVLQPIHRYLPKLSGIILLLAGIASLGLHLLNTHHYPPPSSITQWWN
ncbi:sulfite exporter TauE/SafE family protein [bacterium]|nr:sulfite exporter TauE/SafE family protein [bacterium]